MTADAHGSGRAYTTDDVSRPQRPHAVCWSPLNRLPWTRYMSTHRTSSQPTQRGVWLMALYALNWRTSRSRIWQNLIFDTDTVILPPTHSDCPRWHAIIHDRTIVLSSHDRRSVLACTLMKYITAIGLMETTDWCSTRPVKSTSTRTVRPSSKPHIAYIR